MQWLVYLWRRREQRDKRRGRQCDCATWLEWWVDETGNTNGCQEPLEARREAWDIFSPRASRRSPSYRQLDFRYLASRTTNEYTSVVLSHSTCGNWLWEPWESDTYFVMSKKTWLSLIWSDKVEEGTVDRILVRKPAVVESCQQGFIHRSMGSGLCTMPSTQ